MSHCFIILKDNELIEYTRYDDIPMEFDNLICYKPEIIPPPHTEEQHKENEVWEYRIKELLARERK